MAGALHFATSIISGFVERSSGRSHRIMARFVFLNRSHSRLETLKCVAQKQIALVLSFQLTHGSRLKSRIAF